MYSWFVSSEQSILNSLHSSHDPLCNLLFCLSTCSLTHPSIHPSFYPCIFCIFRILCTSSSTGSLSVLYSLFELFVVTFVVALLLSSWAASLIPVYWHVVWLISPFRKLPVSFWTLHYSIPYYLWKKFWSGIYFSRFFIWGNWLIRNILLTYVAKWLVAKGFVDSLVHYIKVAHFGNPSGWIRWQ